MNATWEEFEWLRLTVGVITEVEDFAEARVPAYKLTIDFGPEIGTKRSSAQLTHYGKQDLLGRQRQEGQQRGGQRHADHVAEVGARRDADVLERVGKGAPAFLNALA